MGNCASHPDSNTRRRGTRKRNNGTVLIRFWCPQDGGHSFSVVDESTIPETPPKRTKRFRYQRLQRMVCIDPNHGDAKVTKNGTQKSVDGTWQRYLCTRPDGSSHTFQTLKSASGSVVLSNTPPPECPEHPGSHVVRQGKQRHKGATETSLRQRYRCTPTDGSPPHRFVPQLARAVVAVGEDACGEGEELLSPHRGGQAVARGSRHSLKAVCQCLAELSGGTSYAQASEDLRRRTEAAVEHQQTHHHWLDTVGSTGTLQLAGSATNSSSYAAQRSKNGWRLAADLTEQYSPLLWSYVSDRIQAREAKQRELNDAVLADNPGAVLADPLVWVLDELPVIVHRKVSKRSRYQQTRWHMLVVSEVRWHHRPTDTPFDTPPMRDPVMRLVRAYPGASEEAWRLVLDELAVRPDFVVSDFGSALRNAIANHYPAGTVGHVPSFFHMARNIRQALLDKPGAYTHSQGRRVVVEVLEKHLDVLTRDDLVLNGAPGWSDWWDSFLDTLTTLKVPLATFTAQRRVYEQAVADSFPLLRANPHLPASNASVEVKIRTKLEPLLVNRKQRYRNIGRVNALLDLVVCREQGLFLDMDSVAALLRASNDEAGGWAPKGRQICDIHPSKSAPTPVAYPYSSLLDPFLTEALYEHRKVGR